MFVALFLSFNLYLMPPLGDIKNITYPAKPYYIDRPEKITAPVVGTRKAIVILVDFSDNPHSYNKDSFSQLLFGTGTGTMKDYYKEVSYSNFSLDGIVTEWVLAPHPYSYYCNNTTSPYGFGDYPGNVFGLVEDAVTLANSNIDFSQFDMDGDTYVDAIFIVHAGHGAEETGDSNTIWSHKSSFSDAHGAQSSIPEFIQVDGVKVNVYSMEPEALKNGMITIGVFCHEFGHVLGLPDLYDVDYSSNGIGDFCLMAGGSWLGDPTGSSPAHPTSWCKYVLDWISPTPIEREGNREQKNAQFPAVEFSPTAYRLLPNRDSTFDWSQGDGEGEYFLVENRQQTGYDSYLPGSGLLILHIDESKQTNETDKAPLVGIMQADGDISPSLKNNRGTSGDLWKSDSIGFSNNSIPASYFYDGTLSGVSVSNISPTSAIMSADIALSPVLLAKIYNAPNPFIKTSSQEYMVFKYTPSPGDGVDTLFPDFNVTIFNLRGKKINSLSASQNGSTYNREIHWDGKNSAGDEIASGLYYYSLEIPGRQEKQKGKFTFIH